MIDESARISSIDPAYAEAHDRRILIVDDEAQVLQSVRPMSQPELLLRNGC